MLHRFVKSTLGTRVVGKRQFSSCQYEKPLLFGPMFSSFIFGALFSGFINNQLIIIYQKQVEIHKEIKELRKELEERKRSK